MKLTQVLDILEYDNIKPLDDSFYNRIERLKQLEENMMKHPFEKVKEFMLAGDQDISGHDVSLSKLYAKLVKEETDEYWHGINTNDDIETLDGIADSIWVLVGYAYARGWNIVGAFDEVARSNMSKVDQGTGKLIKRDDGKVLKPATYSPPDLTPYIKKLGDQPGYENMVMGL